MNKVDVLIEGYAADFATNMEELVTGRKEAVKLAALIVPGHGKMMKVEK